MPSSISSFPSFRKEFFRGFRTASPLVIAFIPFGLLLGGKALQKGFTPLEVPLLTGLNFAGGSEFAAVSLWSLPPSIILLASITFLVNSRHLLMGASLAPHLKSLPYWKIAFLLFFMCDEVWALSLSDTTKSPCHKFSTGFYIGVTTCLYLSWVIFTFAGGCTGNTLGDLTRYGLDMAFPAVFIVLLRGMWKGWRFALPWVASLLTAIIVYRTLPGVLYVPAGTLIGGLSTWLVTKNS